MCWFFGLGVAINIALALCIAAIQELNRHFKSQHSQININSFSTALLLAICLPSLTSWWVSVIGTIFALMIVTPLTHYLKFGPLNAVMASYVLLLTSFPEQMHRWTTPANINHFPLTFSDIRTIKGLGQFPDHLDFDAITSATPLETINTFLTMFNTLPPTGSTPILGHLGGAGWEIVSLTFLCGGLWLVYRDIVSWAIPAGVLSGLSLFSFCSHLIDHSYFATPMFHLFTGSTMFGAFFIATDLDNKSFSIRSQLIYGLTIGILVYLIRIAGDYPEGMAFAILIANLALAILE